MLQLNNNTPFAASLALFPNESAVDTLYIIVKASFNIGPKWTLTEEQSPPEQADIYWTEPGKSSVKYASDFHTGKPSTDIVMLGHAYSPNAKEVQQMDVQLSVGAVDKTIRIFGDREWKDGQITSPTPFKSMAMVYEKAYGGVFIEDGQIKSAETRNLVGRGFSGQREAREMNGVKLPNLEDPNCLISSTDDQPTPACYGFSAPNWQPRVSYAGTYDENWQKSRAPYLPADFDKRFFCMAHPDMVYPGYLKGGETVTIIGMNQNGPMQFKLPEVNLAASINVSGKTERPEFRNETLILEPNQSVLSMVWKADMPCDKKALKISEVGISLTR